VDVAREAAAIPPVACQATRIWYAARAALSRAIEKRPRIVWNEPQHDVCLYPGRQRQRVRALDARLVSRTRRRQLGRLRSSR
jgi:hypothetical protein